MESTYRGLETTTYTKIVFAELAPDVVMRVLEACLKRWAALLEEDWNLCGEYYERVESKHVSCLVSATGIVSNDTLTVEAVHYEEVAFGTPDGVGYSLVPLILERIVRVACRRLQRLTEVEIVWWDPKWKGIAHEACDEMKTRCEVEGVKYIDRAPVPASVSDSDRAAGSPGSATEDDVLTAIPEGRYREIVRMWREGKKTAQIGHAHRLTDAAVQNEISKLRNIFGCRIVPYHRERPE